MHNFFTVNLATPQTITVSSVQVTVVNDVVGQQLICRYEARGVKGMVKVPLSAVDAAAGTTTIAKTQAAIAAAINALPAL